MTVTTLDATFSQGGKITLPEGGIPDTVARSGIAGLQTALIGLKAELDQLKADNADDDPRLKALEDGEVTDDARDAQQGTDIAALKAHVDDDVDDFLRGVVATIDTRLKAVESGYTPPSTPAGGPASNDILLKNILPLGGTSDERLTAAVAAQQADPARVIRFTYEDEGRTFTKPQTYGKTGVRILGPCLGMQNPEQNVKPALRIKVNVGTGANSWFVGTTTSFNVMIAGLVVQCDTGQSQLIHHPYSAGTCYAATFYDITLYGFKHGWGMPGDAFSNTLTHWYGTIQFPGIKDTAISLRGSDSWYLAVTNLDAILGGGKYLVRLENWTKSHLANMYLTARDATRALWNESRDAVDQGGTYVYDCVIEGHNAGDPAFGALIVNKEGNLYISRCPINFGLENPGGVGAEASEIDTALVVVLDGEVGLHQIVTNKATIVDAGMPFAHVSGEGTLLIDQIFSGSGDLVPVVKRTGNGRVNPPQFTVI